MTNSKPSTLAARLDHALDRLPRAYPGPGGAAAVLKDGEVIARHAWGFANAERRIPFTPRTLFRMCSITKQFTCALALDAFPDLSALDGDVAARLPRLEPPPPRAEHLAHNQSGLRDYWAVAMLHGAPVEGPFGDAEAARIIGDTRSLQFTPGTRFSYVNQNFRILSDILQDKAGAGFAELLRTRLFDRIGMGSAFLAAETSAMPDGTTGYEGSVAGGFRAAENHILWTGDAGLGASLDDMIAWERHIDATREDPASIYRRLSAPVAFADGAPAAYGFGLARSREFGRPITGHGGALRGWRSHRLYAPADRVSVVVMFNHLANAHGAAMDLFAAALGMTRNRTDAKAAPAEWTGAYVEPRTALAVRIEPAAPGAVRLRFGHAAEQLDLNADGSAGADQGPRLRPTAAGLVMDRPGENFSGLLTRLDAPRSASEGASGADDIAGLYRCVELDAEITVASAGGVAYGAFSGFLGHGRMELLEPVGLDVWALPCPRALDHTPPGDWTLAFRRDGAGEIIGVEVGCWLARRLWYARQA
jgi:D-aminopeptidase